MSAFVLITQNRMAAVADQRADLDLQISLLAEHEVTHLLTLMRAVAERMGLLASHDPELRDLAKDVRPEKLPDKIAESGNRQASWLLAYQLTRFELSDFKSQVVQIGQQV